MLQYPARSSLQWGHTVELLLCSLLGAVAQKHNDNHTSAAASLSPHMALEARTAEGWFEQLCHHLRI